MALAGAVLMPVSLFLHWYAVAEGATGDNSRFTVQGWDAFESTDTPETNTETTPCLCRHVICRSMQPVVHVVARPALPEEPPGRSERLA
jgi:hypothetical protein